MTRQPFTEKEVQAMIAGTIRHMVQDPKFFSYSSVGPQYSNFTEDGFAALQKQLSLLGPQLRYAIDLDDEKRSKQLVFQELKGN